MTAPPRQDRRDAGDLIVIALLATQAVRLVAALVAGVAAATEHVPFAPDHFHTGFVVSTFGSAGDGTGVVLLALAAVVLWARSAAHRSPASASWWRQRDVTTVLLAVTALSAVLDGVGLFVQAAAATDSWRRVIVPMGYEIAYLVAAAGVILALRRLDSDEAAGADSGDDLADEPGAAVFAVDRKTGVVLAWPSVREARAKAPLYGVEDDEYDWFLDDGVVLAASAAGSDVHLTPTPDARPEELLARLTAYAERRGLAVDEPDEPLAYVDPIARDHYLDMWPGWLRWIGRLTR